MRPKLRKPNESSVLVASLLEVQSSLLPYSKFSPRCLLTRSSVLVASLLGRWEDEPEYGLRHSWSVRTLRPKKTERTLRTKDPKAHFYFPEIKYKGATHILV